MMIILFYFLHKKVNEICKRAGSLLSIRTVKSIYRINESYQNRLEAFSFFKLFLREAFQTVHEITDVRVRIV